MPSPSCLSISPASTAERKGSLRRRNNSARFCGATRISLSSPWIAFASCSYPWRQPKERKAAGHGRVEAARLLKTERVPTLRLSHLNDAERRAYILADNKLAQNANWDRE